MLYGGFTGPNRDVIGNLPIYRYPSYSAPAVSSSSNTSAGSSSGTLSTSGSGNHITSITRRILPIGNLYTS